MNKISVFFILLLPIMSPSANPAILDQYIATALSNNLALQQQVFSYEKSVAALQEARGLFMPSIALDARYSRAGGGRKIEIPVGDFVNPIHEALNYLLQQNVFPTNVEVEPIPFLREREQETKLRAVQPLFQPAIYYNYKIKEDLRNIEKANRDAYMRQVVSEVKTAYFNYFKTLEILDLLERTQDLLDENLRVSEKLVASGKATREVIYRAQADLSFLETQKAEAHKNQDLAAAYFNFLLNRPPVEEIQSAGIDSFPSPAIPDLTESEQQALQNREELKQLDLGITASRQGVKLQKSAFLPNIFAVVDYGFQGEKYRFAREDDFWMASAILQWNLFNGFQDKARIQQARLEQKKLEIRRIELEEQIRLQVREAYHNLVVAVKNLQSTRDRLLSEKKSFNIVNKKYQQGAALQIEYLDARNNYISADIQRIVALYDYYIRRAEFEKIIANYPLPHDATER
jgi:outer membrane protein